MRLLALPVVPEPTHGLSAEEVAALTPAERLEITARLSSTYLDREREAIVARYPELGENELIIQLLRLRYGDELGLDVERHLGERG